MFSVVCHIECGSAGVEGNGWRTVEFLFVDEPPYKMLVKKPFAVCRDGRTGFIPVKAGVALMEAHVPFPERLVIVRYAYVLDVDTGHIVKVVLNYRTSAEVDTHVVDRKNFRTVYADLFTVICHADRFLDRIYPKFHIDPASQSHFMSEWIYLIVNYKIREPSVVFGDTVHQVYGLVGIGDYAEYHSEDIFFTVP